MRVIVTSSKDVASANVFKILRDNYPFKQCPEGYKYKNSLLIARDKDTIFIDDLNIDAELFIFASRHKSESGKPCFTCHATGNFTNDSSHGGKPFVLSHTNAIALRSALISLNELNNNPEYNVCLEATHHGPFTDRQSLFVEVGSSKNQWTDLKACEVVAETCFNLLKERFVGKSVIGFGGSHYCPKFTPACLEGYNIGHVCAKYNIPFLNENLIEQMVKHTHPRPNLTLFDKKSLTKKEYVSDILSKFDVEVLRI